MKKRIRFITYFILALAALLIWIPLWMMVTGSFTDATEMGENIGSVLGLGGGLATFPILPSYPTLQPYIELLLDSPKFFVMFWNSCFQVIPTILGQLLVGVPAAWSFARFTFKGKRILFILYIILMIMPFQVTMVSSYLVLNKFKIMDSHLAIILPGIFSTFPVFIMVKFFKAIPEELIEAAKLDGAGDFNTFIKIGIPLGNSGIISAVVLSYLENWNAIEQPLTFLRDKSKWPLSLYLPQISADRVGVAFVASVIMMLPALLIFLSGQTYLEQGIVASGIKQ
ncbi:carbohydrate ABC transporter permease [Clostridium sp. Marseille-P299]|uniref:carbohydrate ABC transporter permease n=1 Tax=Clostridium sp. Marseille-P299 TaxID=1805477 RepID=UPI00082BA285|nr:carbohydrate ABC transporter permease [Clostridium sp. Marseille-P299]